MGLTTKQQRKSMGWLPKPTIQNVPERCLEFLWRTTLDLTFLAKGDRSHFLDQLVV
jgi:hypothetical protein